MKAPYRILLNDAMFNPWHPKPFGEGWVPTDPLHEAWCGDVSLDPNQPMAEELLAAAEWLFKTFNIQHPAGYYDRSLSVGDVVFIGEVALACEPAGWQVVTGPFNIQPNHPDYREA